jgi:carbamoyl-phosphate synthase large subunit
MPQEKIKILVTSAGTASAISVIKSLKLQSEIPVHIFAVDTDRLAAGLYLADEFSLVPPANAPNYIESLIRLANENNIQYLIPIYSKEIQIISAHAQQLKENGIHTFLSSVETIQLCNDKKAMHTFVVKHEIRTPKVYSDEELALGNDNYPLFAKPNTGSSSSGARMIKTEQDLKEALTDKQLIIQEFISGEEVTVDVLCNEKHKPIVIAPRVRLSTKSGQSVKGRTISTEPFQKIVTRICELLQIKGVCNLQFFLSNDEVVFIELNPRFAAGGLMLTVKSGANIPLLLLKLMLKKPINEAECQTRPNYFMTRYWEEIIFEG